MIFPTHGISHARNLSSRGASVKLPPSGSVYALIKFRSTVASFGRSMGNLEDGRKAAVRALTATFFVFIFQWTRLNLPERTMRDRDHCVAARSRYDRHVHRIPTWNHDGNVPKIASADRREGRRGIVSTRRKSVRRGPSSPHGNRGRTARVQPDDRLARSVGRPAGSRVVRRRKPQRTTALASERTTPCCRRGTG